MPYVPYHQYRLFLLSSFTPPLVPYTIFSLSSGPLFVGFLHHYHSCPPLPMAPFSLVSFATTLQLIPLWPSPHITLLTCCSFTIFSCIFLSSPPSESLTFSFFFFFFFCHFTVYKYFLVCSKFNNILKSPPCTHLYLPPVTPSLQTLLLVPNLTPTAHTGVPVTASLLITPSSLFTVKQCHLAASLKPPPFHSLCFCRTIYTSPIFRERYLGAPMVYPSSTCCISCYQNSLYFFYKHTHWESL